MYEEEIMGIFERGRFSHAAGSLVLEFAPMDKPRAFEIAKMIDPSAPKDANCPACAKTVVNILRVHVGMPPLHKEAKGSMFKARITACDGCQEKLSGSLTKYLDQCRKCGCFIQAKARMKNETCPLGKWE